MPKVCGSERGKSGGGQEFKELQEFRKGARSQNPGGVTVERASLATPKAL
jgi:hypothetical protein